MAKKKEEVLIGEGRDFERIRRITGYLVGTIDRWNNAKRAEEKDRIKHSLSSKSTTAPKTTRKTVTKKAAAKPRTVKAVAAKKPATKKTTAKKTTEKAATV